MRSIILVLAVAAAGCNVHHDAGDDETRRGEAAEAEQKLHAIGKAVRLHYAETETMPRGHAERTPAEPCCSHAGGMCPTTAERGTWDGEPWATLDFVLDEDHRFQYDYDSDGTTLVAHAYADLDCNGDAVTFTLRGHIEDDAVVLELDDPLKTPKHHKHHGK